MEKFEKLFSYGTLQQEGVQLATFGRKLEGRPDQLNGYKLGLLEIEILKLWRRAAKLTIRSFRAAAAKPIPYWARCCWSRPKNCSRRTSTRWPHTKGTASRWRPEQSRGPMWMPAINWLRGVD
jgi:hypothetical protein